MPMTMKFQAQEVPVPGLGCMGMSFAYGKPDPEAVEATLQQAVKSGCFFWDSAVVYGAGHNETLLGNFIKSNNARDKVFIASKCGMDLERKKVNNSPEHINEYIEHSIERLGFTPDLYYLHRIDPDTPLEKSIPALAALRDTGKTKFIGLSECSVETLRKANSIAHIDAVQIELSPWETFALAPGGICETCKELGITVIAYSPLGRGLLTGQYKSPDDFEKDDWRRGVERFSKENFGKNLEIVSKLDKIAKAKGCTSGQLALAWVMAQGAIPIPGTRTPSRLDENFSSRKISLTEQELADINKVVEEASPVGLRYPEATMHQLGH